MQSPPSPHRSVTYVAIRLDRVTSPDIRLLLASASPARLSTLRSAGVEPAVRVSGVDEPAVIAAAEHAGGQALGPGDVALTLAKAKAEQVAEQVSSAGEVTDTDVDLVLGCDSVLELDGEIHGKPQSPDVARERWHRMRGRTGVLHSGHWLVDLRDTEGGGTGGSVGAGASTVVHFADLDDAEIDAYIATGEPLQVAGAFTVDGLGGPYVRGIEGDFHNVVGLSLPVVRDLLAELNIAWRHLRTPAQH